MANEAVIVELHGGHKGQPVRFTCADGVGIEKGTLLYLSDPQTAAATVATASGQYFVGIANTEKVANDGSTSIGVSTSGIFDLYATSGSAINAGEMVITSGSNAIQSIKTTALAAETASGSGIIVGRALESTAAGVAETIKVAVGIY